MAMVIDMQTAEQILAGDYKDRDLTPAEPESGPTFKELREECCDAAYYERENDILDDVWADIESSREKILAKWAECREENNQLAFGAYIDEMIERFINDNCYLASNAQ